MSDDCNTCQGTGEVQLIGAGARCTGCPECIERERQTIIDRLTARITELEGALRIARLTLLDCDRGNGEIEFHEARGHVAAINAVLGDD